MSHPENSDPGGEVSPAGHPIYRHDTALPWAAAGGEVCLEQISAHVEAHLGPVETVFHELVSDKVHIDVLIVRPTPAMPLVRLVTSGMSDLPMTTPPGAAEAPRHAELMVTLPPDWPLDPASFKDERWYWPLRLLKTLARLPHQYATWLGWGHTVPNGDPAEPYADRVPFSGAIVLPPVSVPGAFHTLRIDAGKTITFYAVWPLYEAEMKFKLRHGTSELLTRLDNKRVTDAVNLARGDVTKKVLGLW